MIENQYFLLEKKLLDKSQYEAMYKTPLTQHAPARDNNTPDGAQLKCYITLY